VSIFLGYPFRPFLNVITGLDRTGGPAGDLVSLEKMELGCRVKPGNDGIIKPEHKKAALRGERLCL
jgi:hypothetical protein